MRGPKRWLPNRCFGKPFAQGGHWCRRTGGILSGPLSPSDYHHQSRLRCHLAETRNMNRQTAQEAVNAVVSTPTQTLIDGHDIKLPGLGRFSLTSASTAARSGPCQSMAGTRLRPDLPPDALPESVPDHRPEIARW
ncbi:HU family DNA-binding protein [Acidithiobacillus ferriphilus]|uniref:HU family DNA-binding protein n=1 Tax=Acidithiobacillus ferriphilus TaxID=1689834 RepID=UPI00390CAE93